MVTEFFGMMLDTWIECLVSHGYILLGTLMTRNASARRY